MIHPDQKILFAVGMCGAERAVALNATGEAAIHEVNSYSEFLEDLGINLGNSVAEQQGLYVWEGEIRVTEEDVRWIGEIRKATGGEVMRFMTNEQKGKL